jgi:hypothetical protein
VLDGYIDFTGGPAGTAARDSEILDRMKFKDAFAPGNLVIIALAEDAPVPPGFTEYLPTWLTASNRWIFVDATGEGKGVPMRTDINDEVLQMLQLSDAAAVKLWRTTASALLPRAFPGMIGGVELNRPAYLTLGIAQRAVPEESESPA